MDSAPASPGGTLEQIQNLERFSMPENFRGRSALMVQLWWVADALLFRTSPQFMYGFRRWLLRRFGARIGPGAIIRPSARITYPWKLEVGAHAWIGDDTVIYTLDRIVIGARAVVSQRTYLCAGTHDYLSDSFTIQGKPVVVGERAWLATDVYVAPGVTIGAGTVVGARSSVFTDLPALSVCFGNPARAHRSRMPDRAAADRQGRTAS